MKKVGEIFIKNCTLWASGFDKFYSGIINSGVQVFKRLVLIDYVQFRKLNSKSTL